jgi:hypothetical protein
MDAEMCAGAKAAGIWKHAHQVKNIWLPYSE